MAVLYRAIIALLIACLVRHAALAAGRDRAAERQRLREKAAAQAAAAAAAAGGVKAEMNPKRSNNAAINNININIQDATVSYSNNNNNNFEYALVIDAGSTGSRGFIVKFSEKGGKRELASIKGKKVTPGISSLSVDKASASLIVDYLLPVIIDAAKTIPAGKHNTTKVYIKGTAGMRLLSSADQKSIWKTIYDGLKRKRENPFKIDSRNLGTISGRDEAYYAVLASNYVAGRIDGELKRVPGTTMVGALDMGGSSTQMIFHTKTGEGVRVSGKDFWSHSWLNYGVEVVRERVIERLVVTHLQSLKIRPASNDGISNATDGGISKDETDAVETETTSVSAVIVVTNPCTFVGHKTKWNDTVVLRGSGDSSSCLDIIKSTLWPSLDRACRGQSPCAVGGVKHPPVQGEFYGMSVYFYALDAVRALKGSKKLTSAWPNPTISELKEGVSDFCGSSAEEALRWARHAYTRDDQVVHRCLEGLYMTALLELGFGFDTESRNLTIALDVRGTEVEWTLGFALDQVPLGYPKKPSIIARLLGVGRTQSASPEKGAPQQKASGGDSDSERLCRDLKSSNDELLRKGDALGASNRALGDEVAQLREVARQQKLLLQRDAEQVQQQEQQQEAVQCDCSGAESKLAGKDAEVADLEREVESLRTDAERLARLAEDSETKEQRARAELSVMVTQEKAAAASAVSKASDTCRADIADARAQQEKEVREKDEAIAALELELRAALDALSEVNRQEEEEETRRQRAEAEKGLGLEQADAPEETVRVTADGANDH